MVSILLDGCPFTLRKRLLQRRQSERQHRVGFMPFA